MNTAVINIKVQPDIKRAAIELADEFGLSLSAFLNVLIKKALRTRTVVLGFGEEGPSEYMIKALKESGEDIRNGRVISFDSGEDALKYLDKMIDSERRRKKISKKG